MLLKEFLRAKTGQSDRDLRGISQITLMPHSLHPEELRVTVMIIIYLHTPNRLHSYIFHQFKAFGVHFEGATSGPYTTHQVRSGELLIS